MDKKAEYGYFVELAWLGQVFVIANSIEEVLEKLEEAGKDFAGFTTGQLVKVIR